MSDIRFKPSETLRHLKNLKKVIETEPLQLVDSDTPGDKYTEANWGLCTNSKKVYNKPSDSMFKERFVPKYHDVCPMDRNKDGSPYGCFYRCRLFKERLRDKDKAIELVNISIEKYKKMSEDE